MPYWINLVFAHLVNVAYWPALDFLYADTDIDIIVLKNNNNCILGYFCFLT